MIGRILTLLNRGLGASLTGSTRKALGPREGSELELVNLNDCTSAGSKILEVCELVRREFQRDIIGAEFGVAYGGGIQAVGRMWRRHGVVYGFDTFEGQPQHIVDTDGDVVAKSAVDMWYEKYGTTKLSLDYIESVLSSQGLENVKLVKGLVDAQTDISYIPYLDYVLLDLDFPTSMRVAYDLIKSKLTLGSYLCLHDVAPVGCIPGLYEFYQELKGEGLYEVVMEDYAVTLVALKRISHANPRLHGASRGRAIC